MSVLLPLSASNVRGNTKCAVVNTVFFIGYCAGCIGSLQLWTEKPRYTERVITTLLTWALPFFVAIAYRCLCMVDHKEREIFGNLRAASMGRK